ncbi:MAG: T9SS type A sorting domain-containing protein [Bacteroidaceae bacterium]|nr:T9SS type A sorting domain-containing protein [Bacteroidaceae bacterium]
MKKFVFLLIGLFIYTAASADDKFKQYDCVQVLLTDGRIFDIEIDAESSIYSYTKDSVQYVEVIGKREEYIFERTEMRSVKFIEAVFTSIDNLPIVDDSNPLRYADGALMFHRSLNGATLYIFDAAGKQMLSAVVCSDSHVSLKHFAKGIYVAQVNGYRIKVVVR